MRYDYIAESGETISLDTLTNEKIPAMTTKQYLAALKKLGLTPASKHTASALGLSVRQCQRLAAGGHITKTVVLLLECLTSKSKGE